MKLKQIKGVDILFYFVIAYVLVAGSWWAYLLCIKNEDAMRAKQEVLWLHLQKDGITDRQVYLESAEYTRLVEHYGRQRWMIFGESAVLLALIVMGIWKIAKSRQKELALAEQQRNFLLSITHELKSPIAVIKLTLDTFSKRKLTEEQQNMLTKNALNDTERLNRLVEDLLLAARVDGGYQYIFEPTDLNDLTKKCIKMAAPKYAGSIEFDSTVEDAFIKNADQKTLTFAVMNLIENAIKYAKDTSKIMVKLALGKDNNYCLEVADFGKGIPKTEREHIFNKFYRVGNEDTRQTKGTGLGLYIAKEIVKAHRGQIFVRSNQPKGSIFSIVIPKI